MYGKMRKNIGFSLIPFAFLFLFEPNYALIDILPDFIGYFIICLAIINLADVNLRIREAFWGFRKAILISICKYIALYLLNKFFVDTEQNVSLLLFTFVFSFLELIVLVPAYKKLFEGFLSLGLLYGGEAVYYAKKAGRANVTEKIFRSTIIFVLIQKLCATLPEFTTLISHDFYEFIKLLRVFGILIVLPVGIVWVVRLFKYFKRVRSDMVFISTLSDLYLEKAEANPHFFTVRVLSTGLLTLAIGLVCTVDIYSDRINFLPDFIPYLLLLVAIIFLRKYSKSWLAPASSAIVGLFISAGQHYTNNYFSKNFYFSEIAKNLEAYNAYYTAFYFKIAEAIVFGVTFFLLMRFLWNIYSNFSDLSRSERGREHNEIKRVFVHGTISLSILAILTLVSGVFYFYAQPFFYTEWYYYYSMTISVVINLIFALYAWFFLNNIKNIIKRRYSLYL
jgi:hypothetical protein